MICLSNKLPVEASLTASGFVTSHKQDRSSVKIECESNTPHTTTSIETEFFHILVTGPVQNPHMRPPQVWAKCL